MLGSEGVIASHKVWGWIAAGSLNSSPSYTTHLHPPHTNPFNAHANTTLCDALTKISVQIPAKFSNMMFKNSRDFFWLYKEVGKLLNSEKGAWNTCYWFLWWETEAAEEMINICQVPKVTSQAHGCLDWCSVERILDKTHSLWEFRKKSLWTEVAPVTC